MAARARGEILTLLIALEFNHTLQHVVRREQSIIQTKVVLLIALLALARISSSWTSRKRAAPSSSGSPPSRWCSG